MILEISFKLFGQVLEQTIIIIFSRQLSGHNCISIGQVFQGKVIIWSSFLAEVNLRQCVIMIIELYILNIGEIRTFLVSFFTNEVDKFSTIRYVRYLDKVLKAMWHGRTVTSGRSYCKKRMQL